MSTTDPLAGADDRAAVDKAFSLLVAFGAQAASGVGVSELARRADLSKSTAFRVLGMLERNGVVEKVGRKYRLGLRLYELGRMAYAPELDRVRDDLMPFVTDLYESVHETVHLGALHGTDVVYLAKLRGQRQIDPPSRVGGRIPAHATGVGKVLLAHSPAALALLDEAPLARFTSGTVCSREELHAQLDVVRRSGIAVEREEVRPGLACMAAPVFGPGGRVIAALSVSVPVSRFDERRISPALRAIAGAASQRMGRGRGVRPVPVPA